MKRAQKSVVMFMVVILLVAVGAMTAACTAEEETPAEDTAAPVETPEADSTEPAAWEAAAAETLDGACTQCHGAIRVFLTPYGNWGDTITRMEEEHNAVLTEEEKAEITKFLQDRTPTPAELVIKDKCTTCHEVGRIYEQPQGDWEALVQRMVEKHQAPLTAEEQQLVIEYLTESYKTTQ